ncbi:uncharacterized protein LOC131865742 [Cryptomeria japonica]|uniref:uncharacterized protein LOC131865742 n=1 Tax=Cryptomeria japonica TaxID=3369 RepID=UPI0027D9E81E|nr:uncharacterized protein LOC131865742 [Cryptomeria japonica]
MDKRSAQGEDFVVTMKEIHEQVKTSLQQSANKYKLRANVKRRDVQFKVGDLVMAYLRKEKLPKGQPSKLLMKKIGPLWVIHKFGNNAHEVELLAYLGVSPIFNVCDLAAFKGSLTDATPDSSLEEEDVEWMKDLPPSKPLELECILDSKGIKQTMKGVYKDYLVKWKGLPESGATWMSESDILKHGTTINRFATQGT